MTAMVRAAGLRGVHGLITSLRGNADVMLERHHLPNVLGDEDALLSVRSLVELFEDCAASLNCPNFGLRLAEAHDISVLGPLAIAIQHSSTVGESLSVASRFLFVHSPAMVFTPIQDIADGSKFAELRYEILLPRLPLARQSFDLGLGVLHRIFKLVVGENYPLQRIHFPHTPVAERSAYTRFFGAPVLFNQPHAALIVPKGFFHTRLPKVNETLHQIATYYLLSQFDPSSGYLAPRVRVTIAKTLGTSQLTIDVVAKMLALHPRTLQRHLASENTTFDKIREDVMAQQAMKHVKNGVLPFSQIAALVGLSDQTAFTRSFKRWFGETPSAARKREPRS